LGSIFEWRKTRQFARALKENDLKIKA